jgi:hypothetical protein
MRKFTMKQSKLMFHTIVYSKTPEASILLGINFIKDNPYEHGVQEQSSSQAH